MQDDDAKEKNLPVMDNFLASKSAEGKKISSGDFTINLSKAQEKFRRYQMADPAFYVLKLVQAAVLTSAKELDFKFTNDLVRAEFPSPLSVSTLENFKEDLVSEDGVHPAMVHLGKALAGALSSEGVVSVEVRLTKAGRTSIIKVSHDNVESQLVPTSSMANVFVFKVRRKRGFLRRLLAPTKEHAALVSRAYLAPLRLIVDSHELRPIRPGASQEVYRTCGQRKGFQVWQDLNIHYERLHNGVYSGDQKRLYLAKGRDIERPREANFFCDLLLSSPYRAHPDKGVLLFVKDGVVMSTHIVDGRLAQAYVVADADGLTTDISEFAIVENYEFDKRVATIARLHANTQRAFDDLSLP